MQKWGFSKHCKLLTCVNMYFENPKGEQLTIEDAERQAERQGLSLVSFLRNQHWVAHYEHEKHIENNEQLEARRKNLQAAQAKREYLKLIGEESQPAQPNVAKSMKSASQGLSLIILLFSGFASGYYIGRVLEFPTSQVFSQNITKKHS